MGDHQVSCITTAVVGGGMPYLEINALIIPAPPVVRGSLVVIFLTVTTRADSEDHIFTHWIKDPDAKIYDTQPRYRLMEAIYAARSNQSDVHIPEGCTWKFILSALSALEFEAKHGVWKSLGA